MSNDSEYLWYIPNDTKAGHRGDTVDENHNSLATLTAQARARGQWLEGCAHRNGMGPT